MRTALRQRLLPAAVGPLAGALVFAALLGLRGAGRLQSLELRVYDQLLRWQRPPAPPAADAPVVLVAIDRADFDRYGFPLRGASVAECLDRLAALGPSAIGLDVNCDYLQPADGSGQKQAADALLRRPGAVAITNLRGDVPVPPGVDEAHRGQVAYCDILPDRAQDQIVRRLLLGAFDEDGKLDPSLATRLATLYLESKGVSVIVPPAATARPATRDDRLVWQDLGPLKTDDGPYVNLDTADLLEFRLDFKGPAMRTFSFDDVIEGRVAGGDVAGRVVLIGVTEPGEKDYFRTPLNGRGDESESGVALHARAAEQLIRLATGRARLISAWPRAGEAGWLLLFCVAGGGLAAAVRSPIKLGLALAGGAAALAGAAWVAFARDLWIPVAPPALGWFAAAGAAAGYLAFHEQRERGRLMGLFSRHVSPEVAQTIWRERDQFLEGGRLRRQRLVATVLFSDLKGFTPASEGMDPAALMDWLNEYMGAMSRVVAGHGGLINKYIGDAVMALFGVPAPRTTPAARRLDATRAARCALAMRRELAALRRDWQARGLPRACREIGMRVGIHTGPLVAGSLGGPDRLEYTVIGDTVNTAARLESYDKSLWDDAIAADGCRILLSAATAELLDGPFVLRPVGDLALKGKSEKIAVLGLVGIATE